MAKTEIDLPDLDAKLMWRRFRAALWCVVVALAVTAVILPDFEPIPFLTPLRDWLILVSVGVIAWPYFARRWNV